MAETSTNAKDRKRRAIVIRYARAARCAADGDRQHAARSHRLAGEALHGELPGIREASW
jgi:hypothetical protein